MKPLTDSVKDISTAIQSSQILQLSDDKLKVKRIAPVVVKSDLDDYMIYVESLPSHANHDWVINTMSTFGPVNYVSMPRYQKTGKIKGFAFVEFQEKESVSKVLRAFEGFGGLITHEHKPENLISVTSYIKENEGGTEDDCVKDDPGNDIKPDEEDNESIEEFAHPKAKRIKLDNDEQVDKHAVDQNDESEDQECTGTEDVSESMEENNIDELATKKKRKRVRKKKSDEPVQPKTPTNSDNITDLRITSKQTWKKLRNQYLTLQREQIKKIKQKFRAAHPIPPKSAAQKLQLKPTRKINFYGAMNNEDKKPDDEIQENESTVESFPEVRRKEADILNKKPLFTYRPGIIVKIQLSEPCVDVKDFKDEMRQYQQVKYIDVKEGMCEAFLRVDSPESTDGFVQAIACPEYTCSVLSGADEENYWQKIKKDREDKLTKKIVVAKTKQQKVVQTIIRQAIHLRFDGGD